MEGRAGQRDGVLSLGARGRGRMAGRKWGGIRSLEMRKGQALRNREQRQSKGKEERT